MKIGKRYSLGQSQKVAAHAVEWRIVLSLAGAYGEALCENKIWKLVSDRKNTTYDDKYNYLLYFAWANHRRRQYYIHHTEQF